MEELIEEILLRLPPEDPASLVHAALVCKPWRRLISSPRFKRRFLEFHRTPPMLGFICHYMLSPSIFVRTTAFSPLLRLRRGNTIVVRQRTSHTNAAAAAAPLQHRLSDQWRVLDARHGRVLLRQQEQELRVPLVRVLVVWDPMTDELRKLPVLPRPTVSCTAAVLCAATGAGCAHHGCHRGPFRVVFVGTEFKETFVCTYSSDVDAWSEPISVQHPNGDDELRISGGYSPSVLLGKNQLYFGIPSTNAALKYDLELHETSWIKLPSVLGYSSRTSVLTTMADGELGLVRVLDGVLCVWLRMDTTPEEGNVGWAKFKVIDLRTKLHVHPTNIQEACVVGFAEGLGIVFVAVKEALYTVDLETCVVKKQVYRGKEIQTVFPYMRFYSPALEAAALGAEEKPSAAGSSA